MRQFREQVVRLLQFTHQRLPVEQIPRDQQKVRPLLLAHPEHMFKCLPQFPRPAFTVQRPRVRPRAQMDVRDMDKPHPFLLPTIKRRSADGRHSCRSSCAHIHLHPALPFAVPAGTFPPVFYSSQLLTVLGNGITSRILDIPVRYITHRSNPSPNPAWRVEPYFLRSR